MTISIYIYIDHHHDHDRDDDDAILSCVHDVVVETSTDITRAFVLCTLTLAVLYIAHTFMKERDKSSHDALLVDGCLCWHELSQLYWKSS